MRNNIDLEYNGGGSFKTCTGWQNIINFIARKINTIT